MHYIRFYHAFYIVAHGVPDANDQDIIQTQSKSDWRSEIQLVNVLLGII